MNKEKNVTISTLLTRRVAEIIEKTHLETKLAGKKKLRIKLGIDPTGADLHLGHTVPLFKLREFQNAGHTAVLIIGDWTAMIGDPSGKSETRVALSAEQVKANAKTFEKQVFMILDEKKTEVRYQSEWFKNFKLSDIIHLTSLVSVGEMLAHDTFRQRLEKSQQFSLHEMLYPLLQGYDSVSVNADVELGAMEQKFNLLMGRTVQKAFGQVAQDVMLMPYLLGLDGKEKMSKTLGNYVALTDSADEMFGKLMSLPDSLIVSYFELCTFVSAAEILEIKKGLMAGKTNPKAEKIRLAKEIVKIYRGEKQAAQAAENFEKKFGKHKDFSKIEPDKYFTLAQITHTQQTITWTLVAIGLAGSKSEARRKIIEGAVEVDGMRITDPDHILSDVSKIRIVRLGKRFAKRKQEVV